MHLIVTLSYTPTQRLTSHSVLSCNCADELSSFNILLNRSLNLANLTSNINTTPAPNVTVAPSNVTMTPSTNTTSGSSGPVHHHGKQHTIILCLHCSLVQKVSWFSRFEDNPRLYGFNFSIMIHLVYLHAHKQSIMNRQNKVDQLKQMSSRTSSYKNCLIVVSRDVWQHARNHR